MPSHSRHPVHLACHPAWDGRLLERAQAELEIVGGSGSARQFERRLKRAFPLARVLESPERRGSREDGEVVWHVYRDGNQAPMADGQKVALVVDDDPLNRSLARQLLQRCGFRVLDADSARTAEVRCLTEPIDLLVTDYQMPGDSGMDLAHELRSRDPGLPVVVVSAARDIEDLVLEANFVFLAKPFEAASLMEIARRLVDPQGHPDRRRTHRLD